MPTLLDECPPARLDCAPALDDPTAGLWTLLYVKAQREKRLAFELNRDGIDYFLPLSERVRRTSYRQRIVTIAPLFPHYLFLRGDADTIGRALATQHIFRTIPIVNQAKVRSDLANLERAIQLNPGIEAADGIVVGTEVEVVEGPYMGLRGVVTKRGKDTLLQIKVESVGFAVLEIDASRVQSL